MQFTTAEVGVVNKVIGLWLTILGALLGGALMIRLGLWRALLLFGILQMLSNLGFWWLAVNGRGALPGLTLPPFDWGFVMLAEATPVDGGLLLAIASENITSGMGTAAFLAFLMSLCNRRFSATQFALLSAFASVGRVWVGPFAGVLAQSIGWPAFFIVSTIVALPALALLLVLRKSDRYAGDRSGSKRRRWLKPPRLRSTFPAPAAAPSGGLRRRSFVALLGGAALAAGGLPEAGAREGVEVPPPSQLSKLVSAQQVEQAAAKQYNAMLGQASQKRALAPASHPQVERLRYISQRLIPHTYEWNPQAKDWRWEVLAHRDHVTAVDLVDVEGEPFAGDPALELEREHSIVAAGQHPRRNIGPCRQGPWLIQRRHRLVLPRPRLRLRH